MMAFRSEPLSTALDISAWSLRATLEWGTIEERRSACVCPHSEHLTLHMLSIAMPEGVAMPL